MSRTLSVIAVLMLQLYVPLSYADLKLGTLFRDGVVLQRDKPVAVWGTADAGKSVTVQIQGQTKTTSSDAHGRWLVQLDPLKASTAPDRLLTSGKNTVTVNGGLVGDV